MTTETPRTDKLEAEGIYDLASKTIESEQAPMNYQDLCREPSRSSCQRVLLLAKNKTLIFIGLFAYKDEESSKNPARKNKKNLRNILQKIRDSRILITVDRTTRPAKNQKPKTKNQRKSKYETSMETRANVGGAIRVRKTKWSRSNVDVQKMRRAKIERATKYLPWE